MATLKLATLLNGADNSELKFASTQVYDKTKKATLDTVLADLESSISGVNTTLNTFLNGAEDGGDLDRLVELVKDINDNKDSIEALTADNHSHDNKTVLDAISANTDGNLVYNGHALDGTTGIAFGATAATASDFTGQSKVVLEEFDDSASA